MMKGLRLYFYSEEPLILSDGRSEGSIHSSLDFVAGSKFLGAFAGVWKHYHPGIEAFDSPEFRSIFLDGTVLFGNATLEFEGRPCFRLPLALVEEKREGESLVLSNQLLNGLCDRGEVPAGYLDFADSRLLTARFEQAMHLNLLRKGERGRTHGYETIASGTPFVATFYCQDAAFPLLHKLLTTFERLQLGRSRSAGYGTVRITKVEDLGTIAETVPVKAGEHSFYLESVFLPEKTWQNPLEGFLTLLREHLGEVELISAKTFTAIARADGFNIVWTQPKVTRHGLRAGSVLTVKTGSGTLPLTLGASALEGFGRYQLDLPLLQKASLTVAVTEGKMSREVGAEDATLPAHILGIWRRRSILRIAQEQAIAFVYNTSIFTDFFASLVTSNRPSSTQRGNLLRLIVSQSPETWTAQFTAILGKQPGKQWKNVRASDPFSATKRRGNLDEIVLRFLRRDEMEALIASKSVALGAKPELVGGPMSSAEETLFAVTRHRLLLVELLRRWDKEVRTGQGGK